MRNFTRFSTLGGAILIAGIGASAQADTVTQFTSFWVLGDSLSDDGNLFEATGGARPAAPYFEGRFSNGPVWSEHVSADFTAQGLASGNFAYGGATVGPNPQVPDLGTQIGLFGLSSQDRLGARPIASLWMGANDLVSGGIPNGNAAEVGARAAEGVALGALALGALGVRDILLFNLPALDKVPLYSFASPEPREQARLGTLAFNATLDARADDLRKSGLNVIEVDMFSLFNALLEDPQDFGVANATTPCYVPDVGYCGEAAAQALAFFDPLHPNDVIHGQIADILRGEVAPVPLPAPALLLIGGMLMMALTRAWAQGSRIA